MSQLTGRLADGSTATVSWEGDRITSIEASSDAAEGLLLPGLVDIQVNGYAGFDVNAVDLDTATMRSYVDALAARGTTSSCPTVITATHESIVASLTGVARAVREDPVVAASVLGIHVEGPYLSTVPGAVGAHDGTVMHDPDPAELAEWIEAAEGLLRWVTLAPERPGTGAYIEAATKAGVRISVGHCDASPEDIHAAADAGATMCTHLGNGIQPELPRHPNQIWSQLAEDRLHAGFIGDGHHLPADAFVAMLRAKGLERSYLVSDAATLAGVEPGIYQTPVGGEVEVTADGAIKLVGRPGLAGSGACLAQCLEWITTSTPYSLTEILPLATSQPADLVGAHDRGRIEVGAVADLVLFSEDWQVQQVVRAGQPLT
ncbi:N-acetylglucosamine-6-phosphate deacetylase [Parenemella sanctibonifatiensis]|uniref:N-acetylglucosamine-6-phosphate deacetylase n=1 Tax=Parenemella sanctibonifatiensis TaxID=2016505 RepID=A0A255E4F3_9ACTN|nr:amidohydrolase family protein [Parenemella sanctibonifatiensis]OYN86419.1 N-acetylglucosamine-6-phosphate deacetylase [Parenemella sanctibonifatiensis]